MNLSVASSLWLVKLSKPAKQPKNPPRTTGKKKKKRKVLLGELNRVMKARICIGKKGELWIEAAEKEERGNQTTGFSFCASAIPLT